MTSSVPTSWGSLILHVIPTGKEIGRGTFGKVFEVNYEGTLCAAKEVHTLMQGDEIQKIKDDFLCECQIWSSLRHPYVVQFLGVYYPSMDQYRLPVMVMEKMQHSLRGLVEKYDNIPLNVKLSILDEVCLGLRYLHSRNPPIVHGDLTPNNILLSYRLEAKITNVGVAKVIQTTNTTKAPGSTDFMSPESLADRPVYGVPLDVFSYGGVILYMVTQLWPQPLPWTQIDPDTDKRVCLSEIQRRQCHLDKMTGGAADLKPLVISCLDDNPKRRPTIAQVSVSIKKVKDVWSQKSSGDRMSPMVWWAEVSGSGNQSQVASSLTTALEEMTINNEQLRREIDVLKSENDKMKNENKKLQTENDLIKAKNIQLEIENNDLKAPFDNSTSFYPSPVTGLNHKMKQQLVLKESTAPSNLFSQEVNIKWEEGTPAPVGQFEHTAVWLNGLVYVGGGYEYEWKKLYTINCYDPVSNSWSSPINVPYSLFAMTTLNNKLLIAGGMDGSEIVTNQILTLADGQLENYIKMIIARSSTTAAGHQGMLIITGGEDDKGKKLSSTELFDSDNTQWYTCDNLLKPHSHLKSVIVDNILYLLGGFDKSGYDSSAVFTASLDTLSLHQLQWDSDEDTPCCWSAPVSINDTHLLIVGGGRLMGHEYSYSSGVYKLNEIDHNWEAIGHIPSARYLSAAVNTGDNKLIIIGGANDKFVEGTNTVWIGSYELPVMS